MNITEKSDRRGVAFAVASISHSKMIYEKSSTVLEKSYRSVKYDHLLKRINETYLSISVHVKAVLTWQDTVNIRLFG